MASVRSGARHSLPVARSSLVGREEQIAHARDLLLSAAVPLLTLTGPGGVGKTRLALAIAQDVSRAFDCGVIAVELAPLADPTMVLPTIAHALDVAEAPHAPMLPHLIAAVQGERLLLILDNCEHLLPDVATAAAELLRACPLLQVLATSREPLCVEGEQELPVWSLRVPSCAAAASPEALLQNGAVKLFVERARAGTPAFALDDHNAAAVAEICRRVDGLPLAIELVAARTKILSPTALLDRLERRLPVLTGGRRDLPARLQTMSNAIAWSYDLLTEAEQTLFRRLAAFAGGWTLEAAEAVAGGTSPLAIDTFEALASLLNKSLLRSESSNDGETRFSMLETIREYAEEQLEASPEAAEVRRRHTHWFLELAERAEPELLAAHQVAWLQRLEAEHNNFRAALTWSLVQGETELGLRLCGALIRLWRWHGHLPEGQEWTERFLREDDLAPPAARAKALIGLGLLANLQGDSQRAVSASQEALRIYRQHDDRVGMARALFHLGEAALSLGDQEHAQEYLWEAVEQGRQPAPAIAGISLKTLGYIARLQGEPARAAALLDEALAICRAVGFLFGAAEAAFYRGEVALDQGNHPLALTLLAQAITAYHDLGDRVGISLCLFGLARHSSTFDRAAEAARLLGVAESLLDAVGHHPTPGEDPRREALRRRLRATLGDRDFHSAVEEGKSLSLDAMIGEALKLAEAAPRSRSQRTAALGLTPKEREVLCLVSEGLSNPEIADRLFVSRRTVTSHIEHIFAKLDVHSRMDAARFAREQGLC